MRRTILTALREGRNRLAVALACVVLLATLIGGVHTGAMVSGESAGRNAFVLCSHDTNGNQQQPTDPRADLCCVAGCLAHAPALAAPPPPAPEPALAGSVTVAKISVTVFVRAEIYRDHQARGPPSLA